VFAETAVVLLSVVGSLEAGNSLVPPILHFSRNDILVAFTELSNAAVYVPAHARHFGIFARLSFPN
jgi:hypothetical protein